MLRCVVPCDLLTAPARARSSGQDLPQHCVAFPRLATPHLFSAPRSQSRRLPHLPVPAGQIITHITSGDDRLTWVEDDCRRARGLPDLSPVRVPLPNSLPPFPNPVPCKALKSPDYATNIAFCTLSGLDFRVKHVF